MHPNKSCQNAGLNLHPIHHEGYKAHSQTAPLLGAGQISSSFSLGTQTLQDPGMRKTSAVKVTPAGQSRATARAFKIPVSGSSGVTPSSNSLNSQAAAKKRRLGSTRRFSPQQPSRSLEMLAPQPPTPSIATSQSRTSSAAALKPSTELMFQSSRLPKGWILNRRGKTRCVSGQSVPQ
jgi:hypothetical protein